MAGAFVLVTMAVVAVIASRSSADALSGKAEQGLAASTDALVATLDVYEKGLESNVRQIFGAFLGTLPQTTITLVLDERIPVGERDAPALRMDDRLINGDFAIVDDFTTNTEAVVTVFVLDGGDFIRINNSLMNDAGLRVMGTALSRELPAYELLLAGEPYTGSANLFGVDYVTQYEPLFSASGTTDDDGAVIGAIFVGVRYDEALAALEEKFGALDLGDGGRIVVVEGQGDTARFAVHPRLAGTPLAGDEAKPEASAFADSVARGPGAYTLDLPLLAGDGVVVEEHRVVVREFAPWKWTLVALAPESEVAAEARALGWRVAGFSLLGALVIIAAIVWLSRKLVALPLARAAAFAGAVASGDLDARPDGKAQAEIGALNRALSDMIDKLRERQDLERRAAAQVEQLAKESSAVANALDAASSAVMMTDADHAIRYVNRAMAALLAAAEPVLAEAVPGFTATQAVGLDFQHFHALDETNGPGAVEKTFGGRVFLIETSPWFDEAGVYSGSVVGWTERTAELAVQDEVRAIVAQAAAGDLSGRIALDGKQGFIRELGEAINALLDATRGGVIEVQAVLAALVEGDLSVRSNAALRGVFASMRDDANRSAEHLSQVIAAIREAAQSISTASGEIAAGNRDLSARTEQQAASLEETASSMDELTATVKQNAEAAKQAEALAASAADVAVEGGKVVADVVTTMAQIQASSKKIGDIVGTINGIAFQTNILAINAAIEAARAGESGRGFAVVASEVRSLAQRTADASKQIRGIIDESNRRIGAGTEQAGRAGGTMQQIVGSVRRVTDLIGDISAASVEQAQGIQQVNEAITQIDETTQQNAALVEEASAAAHSMEEQAADLMGLVERFRLADASDA